jgi:hypothetical protein
MTKNIHTVTFSSVSAELEFNVDTVIKEGQSIAKRTAKVRGETDNYAAMLAARYTDKLVLGIKVKSAKADPKKYASDNGVTETLLAEFVRIVDGINLATAARNSFQVFQRALNRVRAKAADTVPTAKVVLPEVVALGSAKLEVKKAQAARLLADTPEKKAKADKALETAKAEHDKAKLVADKAQAVAKEIKSEMKMLDTWAATVEAWQVSFTKAKAGSDPDLAKLATKLLAVMKESNAI